MKQPADPAIRYSRAKVIAARVVEALFAPLVPLLSRRANGSQPRGILIVEPFGLGDIVLASALVEPLRQRFPGARIGVVCDARWRDFVATIPGVDEVIAHRFPWTGKVKRLTLRSAKSLASFLRLLRGRQFDLGIDIRGDIRSQVMLVAAGCSTRVGFTDYMGSNITQAGWLLTHKGICGERPRLQELSALLAVIGIEPSVPLRIRLASPPPRVGRTGVLRIGIHVGAGWQYKKWQATHWHALAAKLYATRSTISLIMIGEEGDRPELESIARSVPCGATITVPSSVSALATEIAGLDVLLCHDSAPLHIAVGYDVPAVALFGPGLISRWEHKGKRVRVVHHQEQFSCAPCAQLACIHPTRNCVASIEVHEVFAAVEELLTFSANDLGAFSSAMH